MEKFEFYVDRKITDWVREYHLVEADSLEDAKKKMIDAFHKNMCCETYDYQYGLNVVDFMEPGENGGNATAELYTTNGDLLITNID